MASSPFALRLSHAASWVKCPAFVRMNATPQAGVVEAEADHTVREEGTAIHWVAEQLHIGAGLPLTMTAPNGVELTDELIDAAEFYTDVLQSNSGFWYIEQLLRAPYIHDQCGGTPDAFSFRAASAPEILLYDLKGGYRTVEVFPNDQLFGYLSAVLTAHPEMNHPDTIVEFCIVQPRAYHADGPVRKHRMRLIECAGFIDRLRDAAHRAMSSNTAIAGPQCDDCAGRASCSVAHAAGMRALEVAGEPDVHDLPVAAIDYELLRIEEAIRMLTARQTGLEAQAVSMIKKGVTLPHFAMQAGRGRLKWNDEDTALMLGDAMGKNLRKPAKPITPTQALKFMPRDLIDANATRARGEMKLTRFDSSDVVKAFSKISLEHK